jgi:hypothetical protein
MVLGLPLGPVRDHYGSFDRFVVWGRRPRVRARHRREWAQAGLG